MPEPKLQSETRSIELEIEVNASPEAVWDALTDATQITNWFAPEARVTGEEGGDYWVSWGGGMEVTQKIEVWEPGKRLVLGEQRPNAKLAVEFSIQGTTLRLVHSGFGSSEEWDKEIEGLTNGWTVFLQTLRNAVSRPRCRSVMQTKMVSAPARDLWNRWVQGTAGNSFEMNWAEPLSGDIEFFAPPNMFIGSFRQHGGGYVTWMIEGFGDASSVTLLVQTFGLDDQAYAQIRNTWTTWLEQAVTL